MPMRRRLMRVFVTLATLVVAWLVASPARAAAPVCDPRGAIMFAPPPQIQDAEQSLDVVDACDGRAEDPRFAKEAVPGRAAQLDLSSSQEPATAGAPDVPLAAPLARSPAPEPALAHAPSGVRSAVDRPPRG